MPNAELQPLLSAARGQKISINPLLLDRSKLFRPPSPLPPILDIRDTFVFSPDPPAKPWPTIDRSSFDEKLALNKETRTFLAAVSRGASDPDQQERDVDFEDIRHIRAIEASFQLEEVVVRADFRRNRVAMEKFRPIKPADTYANKDGGLEWSDTVKKEVAIFMQESRIEKLVIHREIQNKLSAWVARPDVKEEPDFDPVMVREVSGYGFSSLANGLLTDG